MIKPPRNRAGVLRLAKRLYGPQAVVQSLYIGMKYGQWEVYAYNHYRMMSARTLRELGRRLHSEWRWTELRGDRGVYQ